MGKSKSCYDRQTLLQMTKNYNASHKDKLPENEDSETLWNHLEHKMYDACKDEDESCWLKYIGDGLDEDTNPSFSIAADDVGRKMKLNNGQEMAKKRKKSKKRRKNEELYFVPRAPKSWQKPNVWLTSFDIRDVMQNYMDLHKDFLFIGPVSVDFARRRDGDMSCIEEELCDVNVASWLEAGYTKVGIVYNTDPSYLPGAHWIASFFDLTATNPKVFFYDSYASSPPTEVQNLLDIVSRDLSKIYDKYVPVMINDQRHQFLNSECGMYCIHFITFLLHRPDIRSIEEYTKPFALHDKTMSKFRQAYFR